MSKRFVSIILMVAVVLYSFTVAFAVEWGESDIVQIHGENLTAQVDTTIAKAQDLKVTDASNSLNVLHQTGAKIKVKFEISVGSDEIKEVRVEVRTGSVTPKSNSATHGAGTTINVTETFNNVAKFPGNELKVSSGTVSFEGTFDFAKVPYATTGGYLSSIGTGLAQWWLYIKPNYMNADPSAEATVTISNIELIQVYEPYNPETEILIGGSCDNSIITQDIIAGVPSNGIIVNDANDGNIISVKPVKSTSNSAAKFSLNMPLQTNKDYVFSFNYKYGTEVSEDLTADFYLKYKQKIVANNLPPLTSSNGLTFMPSYAFWNNGLIKNELTDFNCRLSSAVDKTAKATWKKKAIQFKATEDMSKNLDKLYVALYSNNITETVYFDNFSLKMIPSVMTTLDKTEYIVLTGRNLTVGFNNELATMPTFKINENNINVLADGLGYSIDVSDLVPGSYTMNVSAVDAWGTIVAINVPLVVSDVSIVWEMEKYALSYGDNIAYNCGFEETLPNNTDTYGTYNLAGVSGAELPIEEEGSNKYLCMKPTTTGSAIEAMFYYKKVNVNGVKTDIKALQSDGKRIQSTFEYKVVGDGISKIEAQSRASSGGTGTESLIIEKPGAGWSSEWQTIILEYDLSVGTNPLNNDWWFAVRAGFDEMANSDSAVYIDDFKIKIVEETKDENTTDGVAKIIATNLNYENESAAAILYFAQYVDSILYSIDVLPIEKMLEANGIFIKNVRFKKEDNAKSAKFFLWDSELTPLIKTK